MTLETIKAYAGSNNRLDAESAFTFKIKEHIQS